MPALKDEPTHEKLEYIELNQIWNLDSATKEFTSVGKYAGAEAGVHVEAGSLAVMGGCPGAEFIAVQLPLPPPAAAQSPARRLHQGHFIWPASNSATQARLSRAQLDALVLGLPWQRIGEGGIITLV